MVVARRWGCKLRGEDRLGKREDNAEGSTILLVEQNIHHALTSADRAHVLETGPIHLSGPAQELVENEHVRRAYPGI